MVNQIHFHRSQNQKLTDRKGDIVEEHICQLLFFKSANLLIAEQIPRSKTRGDAHITWPRPRVKH